MVYLYYVLGSDLVFSQFDQLAAGSTVRNLNIGLVKGVQISVPPLREQHRIVGNVGALPPLSAQRDVVAAVDGASRESERLESIYERKLAALEALKKSLLHQAFTGKL